MNSANVLLGVLAAGSSARLGTPKQLIPYKNTNLINYVLENALKSCVGNVAVVTGYKKREIAGAIKDIPCIILENDEWQSGISSSIRVLAQYAKRENYSHLLISLCDQPGVSNELFDEIISKGVNAKNAIILCKYKGGTTGPPALIPGMIFDKLTRLRGDRGGKSLYDQLDLPILHIDFPGGGFDIDTPEDLDKI